MKRIEAVLTRSALADFQRCARELGIFGFDLSEDDPKLWRRNRFSDRPPNPGAKLKVDFAVLDEDTKPIVHAVLNSVHPESIGIFKFDQDTRPDMPTRRTSPLKLGSLP